MKTLEYYWKGGTHTVFTGYTIDKFGNIMNAIGHVMTHTKNGTYNNVGIRHGGEQRNVRVCRALASTFIGPPPTPHHTADHIDKDSNNDVLSNIRWLDKSGQRENQTRPTEYKAAFVVVKDDIERTIKEWADVFKKPNGERYTIKTIKEYAQQQKHGFRYKVFQDLPGEEWKVIPKSNNSQGEWFISNMSRMKYKTKHAENVMTVSQLSKDNLGYPVVFINGKQWKCHELSVMTFRPEEYACKKLNFIILHEDDNKLDFSPLKLRWGTRPENGFDAYKNGKHDGTKTSKKTVASYINGVFEKNHESLCEAERYLKDEYKKANRDTITRAIENGWPVYGRTWKLVVN